MWKRLYSISFYLSAALHCPILPPPPTHKHIILEWNKMYCFFYRLKNSFLSYLFSSLFYLANWKFHISTLKHILKIEIIFKFIILNHFNSTWNRMISSKKKLYLLRWLITLKALFKTVINNFIIANACIKFLIFYSGLSGNFIMVVFFYY